ncbi:MAG: hypothetical protein JST43_09010 [Bacteroidetes bacterium]|nr:hypothetical protein [Bacteroidota bacterium]MBS1539483.1 hypothetical protein [Bacteroidota bacterium]
MKASILLTVILFVSVAVYAQDNPHNNSNVFQNNMNVIYQNVNRSFVTTGLLLDYGLLVTDVVKFNGTLQSNNYVNRSVWSALYASIYYMQFNSNIVLQTPATVNSQVTNFLVARRIGKIWHGAHR